MREMRDTGYMHNHMRMYWGKKILEWSTGPEEAFATALALNNRYFLDGRDPNSYANVAWCFGLHDRPWPERPIFGTVRSMTQGGLVRKIDADAYVASVDGLVERGSRRATIVNRMSSAVGDCQCATEDRERPDAEIALLDRERPASPRSHRRWTRSQRGPGCGG